MSEVITSVKITQLTPSFGAEVHGVDLSKPISPELGAELRALFFKHRVLRFREQKFTSDCQIAFMSLINKVIYEPEIPVAEAIKKPLNERFTYISNTEKGTYGPAKDEYSFHADMSYTPHGAIQAISLWAEVMENPAPTAFANMVNAVKLLPAELVERLEGMLVENTSPYTKNFTAAGRSRLSWRQPGETNSDYPHAARQVISRHPVTGEKYLTTNPHHSSHFVGWDEAESDKLFAEIDAYVYVPDNIFVQRWHQNDFIVWDNIALTHRRNAISGDGQRTLRRVMANPYELGELYAAAEAPEWVPARKYGKDATMVYRDGAWVKNTA